MDGLGFTKISESPVEQPIVEEQVVVDESPVITEETIETTLNEVPLIDETPVVTEAPIETPVEVVAPVIEREIIDPFKDLGDRERQIFEALKGKDLKTVKDYLDVVTRDYDAASDIDVIRENLMVTKPKWTPEMIELELQEKYGFGVDEDELTDSQVLRFKRDLLEASEDAREVLKGKQTELTFPAIEVIEKVAQVEAPQYTPEELSEFQAKWESHVDEGVQALTDEVINVEIENEGSKVAFDFPVTYTDSDKQGLKTLVTDFDIQKDFNQRYVKDGQIDVKAFARDKFLADNAQKLIKSAFAQGFSKGKINQLKADKNIDLNPQGGRVSGDMTDNRTETTKSFFNNGR
jgi:hypothetical protein